MDPDNTNRTEIMSSITEFIELNRAIGQGPDLILHLDDTEYEKFKD